MAIDERSRHGLFLKLEQVLGPEEATTLMEHLPPVGWADVATKQDLDHLRVDMKKDMEQLRLEMTAWLRGELMGMERHLVFGMVGSMVSISALVFTIAKVA